MLGADARNIVAGEQTGQSPLCKSRFFFHGFFSNALFGLMGFDKKEQKKFTFWKEKVFELKEIVLK